MTDEACWEIIKNSFTSDYSLALMAMKKKLEMKYSFTNFDYDYLIQGAINEWDDAWIMGFLVETSLQNIKLDVNTYINVLYYCHKHW